MGPFPHDAPPAAITAHNPAGTDGFEFVEFAHPRPEELSALFRRMGYVPVARHRSKDITVYRQGDINYILNAEPDSFAVRFVAAHGPCAASMAWRVVDAKHAYAHAVKHGAEPYDGADKTLDAPAIRPPPVFPRRHRVSPRPRYAYAEALSRECPKQVEPRSLPTLRRRNSGARGPPLWSKP